MKYGRWVGGMLLVAGGFAVWGVCATIAKTPEATHLAGTAGVGVSEEAYSDFMANEVLDVQDLAEGAEIQRRLFNTITPPGFPLLQPMFPPVVPFDDKYFDGAFLEGLLGEDKNSVAVYPLSLVLEPKTRETLVYNAEGGLIAVARAGNDWRAWPKDADPSRVGLRLDLLPKEDVAQYLYTEWRVADTLASAAKARSSKAGGHAKRSLGAGQFGFASVEPLTNGNFRLTVTNGGNAAEIYSYTVWHTSAMEVCTWTNEESNVVTTTSTIWTAVSPSFNGLESAWECETTNLALADGVGVWEDANVASNARIRFYAVANPGDADEDSLSDGAEILVYHTRPDISDTDGDGLNDAEEINDYGTDPLDADTDTDGLSDAEEVNVTDPLVADTDHDGWRDGLDPNPKSRAWIDWGNPTLWTNGTTCISNRYWPIWHRNAMTYGGSNDFAASSYNAASNLPVYHYCIWSIVDTNLVGGTNLALWVRVSTSHVGQLYFQLRDAAWNNLVNNFLGSPYNPQYPAIINTASLGASGGEILLTVPMSNAPAAANIIHQRLTNAIAIYDSMLYMDSDGDGLDDTQEAAIAANPTNDYDEDGLADFWECTWGFDFTKQDEDGNSTPDGEDDFDEDGLINLEEYSAGTKPRDEDSDGDGIPDGAEISLGLDPLDAADADEDPDRDHLVNREEYELNLPMNESNEVTMVYFNPDPPAARRYLGGLGNVKYVTWDNLQAKAASTIRYKEGYPEFTNATLQSSFPPKWYLSREWSYGAETDGTNEDFHVVHSEYVHCRKDFDPNGWPSAPSNHICTGNGHFINTWFLGGIDASTIGWDYSFYQPSPSVPVEWYLTWEATDETGYDTEYRSSCDFGYYVEADSGSQTYYSNTKTYVSNDWEWWNMTYMTDDPNAREFSMEILTNEYTDEMLLYYTLDDLGLMPSMDGLEWDQRYARDDHRQEPYVETLPTNEIYCAYLISTNHDELQLQALSYQWTISTTTGTIYKLMWLEAFRPQDCKTYKWYKATSTVFKGTGSIYTSGTYQASFPWDLSLPMESGEPYGTVTPIGFLVQLECGRAEKSTMGFGIDPPDPVCYAVWDDEAGAAKSDQSKINSALTIFFKNASTPQGDPVDFNVTLHVIPEDLPGVSWEKTDGPNSGTLLNSDQPVAIYSNAAKGGLYTFTTTIPGADPITSQLWLPVSGPDISTNFQNEIDYLNNWKPRYLTNLHARVMQELGWNQKSNNLIYSAKQWQLMKGDIDIIGPGYDYKLVSLLLIQDVCGLANVPVTNNKAMDSARLVLYGFTRPYVTDFAKRNNMGYAMCARAMGWPEIAILKGPNFALTIGNAGAGTYDGPDAIAAYTAGIDIMDGESLADTMDEYGRSMQHPGMRLSMEWPSDEVTNATYIALSTNFYNDLENLAGGTP